ncbi:MAG: excinuclease ABC subunit UvrA, partial [bacterium]|nr:excinuclease ABC subunit UvrA [bacterium]
EIPRNKLVVITGLSGSGKSSLAMDTIYAEGQRRYVESLSPYARQFLGQMDKPDVDYIEGLSPAISIDQKSTSRNPRSTVGTVTEIYDYLRVLYARIGRPHCHICGRTITQQSIEEITDRIMDLPRGTRLNLLGPLIRGRKGEYRQLFDDVRRQGFVRVKVDGAIYDVGEEIDLDKDKKHDIAVIVDRLVVKPDIRSRVFESVETALKLGKGLVIADLLDEEPLLFSENFACPTCGVSLDELSPRIFSFNNPYGACPSCSGLGVVAEFDPDLIIPEKSLSLSEGAILPWRRVVSNYYPALINGLCSTYDIDPHAPVSTFTAEQKQVLFYGGDKPVKVTYRNFKGRRRDYAIYFEGLINRFNAKYRDAEGDAEREELQRYMTVRSCQSCNGARLKPESLAVTVGGLSIDEYCRLSVEQAIEFIDGLKLSEREAYIARQLLKEIRSRLLFLADVGLDYLTLNRGAATLAGGEAQRIRLATEIGSGLMGVLYILDEPTIGLHPRDNERLIGTLKALRDLGNTVILVEHDEDTIRAADYILDIGPGAGKHGGRVISQGTVAKICRDPQSITGRYLTGKDRIEIPVERRQANGRSLVIKGARQYSLKGIDVEIPLGMFVCVTGVSGSGKSTLVHDVLFKRLYQDIYGKHEEPGAHDGLTGQEYVDKVINVDQSPIGRTPRSNPATYTGLFDHVRQIFSMTTEARMRGYKPGRFSFNIKGGRCEACKGDGIVKIEMHFLPDVYVPCEVCKGRRYNRETLEVHYRGKSIADVLNMTVDEALEHFKNIPRIKNKLTTLHEVGLGYIKLGQPATTLSGGEAQRVKLATELSRRSTGNTLYILDEPTTGLHFADIGKLLAILDRLVEAGNTVLVIEHNLDVIKCADYLIDLGPEGGDLGGRLVACGTPERVATFPNSHTGRFLRPVLGIDMRR